MVNIYLDRLLAIFVITRCNLRAIRDEYLANSRIDIVLNSMVAVILVVAKLVQQRTTVQCLKLTNSHYYN